MPSSVKSSSIFSSNSKKNTSTISSTPILSNQNLLGNWKILSNQTDYLPGSKYLNDSSLSLKLTEYNNDNIINDINLIIEKKKELYYEEIIIKLYNNKTNTILYKYKYQLDVLNYNSITNDIILSVVKGCSESFNEFTICTYGPNPGTIVTEKFYVDPLSGTLRILTEVINTTGVKFTLIQHLERLEKIPLPNLPYFENSLQYRGWKLYESFPTSCLDNIKLKIIQVNKIKYPNHNTNNQQQKKTILKEIIWKHGLVNENKIIITDEQINKLTRYIKYLDNNTSNSSSSTTTIDDSKDIIEFLIHITYNDTFSWIIPHRYKEFDTLRKFIILNSPQIKEFRDLDQKFPGKTLGIFNHSVAEKRVSLLEAFLMGCLANIKHSKKFVLDAFCCFLGIPNNLFRVFSSDEISPVENSHVLPTPPLSPKISSSLKIKTISTAPNAPLSSPTSSLSSNLDSSKKRLSWVPEDDPAGRASEFLPPWKEGLIRFIDQGFNIKKHGRSGSAKSRKFAIDNYAQSFIVGEKDHMKTIKFDEIVSFYRGSYPDFPSLTPTTKKQLLEQFNGVVPTYSAYKASGKKISGLEFGSATLRRSCKTSEFSLCIVFVLQDRTLDLQFPSERHVDLILNNLTKGMKEKNLAVAAGAPEIEDSTKKPASVAPPSPTVASTSSSTASPSPANTTPNKTATTTTPTKPPIAPKNTASVKK